MFLANVITVPIGVFQMFNLLRFIVIIVVAMIVFGWGVVAGQTDSAAKLRRRAARRSVPSPVVSRDEVAGVRLEAMPEIPARQSHMKSKQSDRTDPFAESPAFSRPDFGPLPKIAWMRLSATQPKQHRPSWNVTPTIGNHVAGLQPARNDIENDANPSFSYSAAPPVGLATLIVQAVRSHQETASKTVSIKSATVNHQLLAQRIKAHNLSARAIEDRLNGQDDWDLTGIESIVSQIDSVIRGQEMWLMYWKILPLRQQRRLGSVVSLSSSLEKLRQRIFEARVATDVDVSLISHLSKKQVIARLESLNEQVEKWMNEIR